MSLDIKDIINTERLILSRIPQLEYEFIWQCMYSSDLDLIKPYREKLEEAYKNLEVVRKIKDEKRT